MKVYIVISVHGEYEDRIENIEKVFAKYEDAVNFQKEFDKERFIEYLAFDDNEDAIYNIVPRDIFDSWPYEEPESDSEDFIYDAEYKGYTLAQYRAQEDRINLAYECWQRSTIEEHEVE